MSQKKGHSNKRSSNMTYSQRKRSKLDYRREYFANNHGLFGCIYFCAYCKRPMFRKTVQVDHIMPLNNVLGRNVRWNLVAACPRCNRAKSDKVDGRVVVGYTSKICDTILFTLSKAFMTVMKAIFAIPMWLFGKSPVPVRIAGGLCLVVAIYMFITRGV